VLTEVENSADNGLNRTNVGVTTACQPNNFSTNSIFLVGESEGSKSCLAKLFNGCSKKVDAGVTNEKLDVVKAEGISVIVRVFAWSKEEEEGHDDHVCSRTVGGIVGCGGLG